jgi:alpha-beta hydrolase superfamily lysophospholipase
MFSRRPDQLSALLLAGSLLLAQTAGAVAAGRPVNLTTADGTQIAGMLYEAAARPAPAVLLVHMLGRSKDEWAPLADRLQAEGITALAIDLRGHGRSGGNGAELSAMASDVQSAVDWLVTQPQVRAGGIVIVGASIGANLAGIVAADSPVVRGVAMLSPSLEYRTLRLDAAVMKKIGERPMWLAASTDDPYSLRTVKELSVDHPNREQRLSSMRAHGTLLLSADQDLARALVDWLKRTLISF